MHHLKTDLLQTELKQKSVKSIEVMRYWDFRLSRRELMKPPPFRILVIIERLKHVA